MPLPEQSATKEKTPMNAPVKKLLVSQVKIVRPFDEAAVPTKIRYSGKQHFVGHDAEAPREDSSGCYENFKVAVGRLTSKQAQTSLQSVSSRHRRSVVGMTKDFLQAVLDQSKQKIEASGDVFPKKVLVAEPLSVEEEGEVSGQWLSNYRANMRTALDGWFEDIDFLPEPFAVFQYYRYGLRHPLLAEGSKHVALVLDFGGGTLDVSVIETTAEGDISHGGKNSRPLSAKSIPAAGFYINQRIAEDILFSNISDKEVKTAARNVIKKVRSFQGLGDDERSLLGERELIFVENFADLLSQVEGAKIRICNSIADWSLSANLHGAVSHLVRVPQNPFQRDTRKVEVSLRAERLRDVFENRVWNEKLRDAIRSAMARANRELNGKPISIVLLSGGSTNIRWLKRLLERDLRNELRDAEILEISENYQEVVAKGLAIECARQFYTDGDGDFGAVTYNRLNLALRPDGKEIELRRFKPLVDSLPHSEDDGTLLPSSTSLRAFLDKPMRWKARLSSAPRSDLQYFYLKSSFDPNDLDSLHNIIDNSVRTPSGTTFVSSIEVELTVRNDGTATPAFIYGRGRDETRVEGRSFYLDMTFADTEGTRQSYLGLDFGTATSALSIVGREHISAYVHRSRDKTWLDLGDLVQDLPYPIAHPLGMYITQTDSLQLEKYGLATLEAALTFIFYVSLCDAACQDESTKLTKMFSDFRRSAGPLKHHVTELGKSRNERWKIASDLLSIIDDEIFAAIDSAVSEAAKAKHFKRANVDYNHILSVLGNHIKRSMNGRIIGIFEGIEKKPFGGGYRGIFRCLEGPNSPFVRLYHYDGVADFSSSEVFLIDTAAGHALPLSPLYVWGLGAQLGHHHGYDLYFADMLRPGDKRYIFASTQHGDDINVGEVQDLNEFAKYLGSFLASNIQIGGSSQMQFTRRTA